MTKLFPNYVKGMECIMQCCPCLNGGWSCSRMATGMAAKVNECEIDGISDLCDVMELNS